MCCSVQYMENNKNLYKVTIIDHYFIFNRKRTLINLTKSQVNELKVPFCKIITCQNGPLHTDVFPTRIM